MSIIKKLGGVFSAREDPNPLNRKKLPLSISDEESMLILMANMIEEEQTLVLSIGEETNKFYSTTIVECGEFRGFHVAAPLVPEEGNRKLEAKAAVCFKMFPKGKKVEGHSSVFEIKADRILLTFPETLEITEQPRRALRVLTYEIAGAEFQVKRMTGGLIPKSIVVDLSVTGCAFVVERRSANLADGTRVTVSLSCNAHGEKISMEGRLVRTIKTKYEVRYCVAFHGHDELVKVLNKIITKALRDKKGIGS